MTRRPRRHADRGRVGHRPTRVGELIRRVVAESLDGIDDERLSMVSVTAVTVGPDLHRAVVYFTSLGDTDEGDAGIIEAFGEHSGRLRKIVGEQVRLRRTPELVFRADTVLRSAESIERLLNAAAADEDARGER